MPSRSTLLPALLLSAPLLLIAPAAHSQMAHEGPAKAIERGKTSPPFDVVSIKVNKTGMPGYYDINGITGILTVVDMPLQTVIDLAYDIKPDQVVGLTGPVSSARFDVTAKILPDAATRATLAARPDGYLEAMTILMLQNRFHLKAHVEQRIKPVYDLVVAKGGSKIKLSQEEVHDSNCNIYRHGTSKELEGKNCTLADIASELTDGVDRTVIDKTGLAGHTDISLKWTDEVAADQPDPTSSDPTSVSIFTAIQDQLGLKLQPSKGPVDTLVIDHIEMPSEN